MSLNILNGEKIRSTFVTMFDSQDMLSSHYGPYNVQKKGNYLSNTWQKDARVLQKEQ